MKFHIVKFNYFIGGPNKVKGGFEIFLIGHCAVDIAGNMNIAGKYQKILVSVSRTLYWAVEFKQGAMSIIP